MHRHIRTISTAVLATMALTLVASAGTGTRAGAAPIDDKRAQAAAIQDQIDANGERISALAEEYNGAQLRLEQAEQAIVDAQAKIEATQREVDRVTALVHERGASVYRRAVSGRSLDGLDLDDARHLVSRRKYAAAQASEDNALLRRLDQAREDLADQKQAAETARSDAAAERDQLEQSRVDLEAANAQQTQILQQVQGELQALIQEEQRRRDAEAIARARSRYGATGDGNPEAFPNLPPPGPAAAAAIEYARAQLGKPYRYAATGPDAFDCSGLTMMAWASAGVPMPHYSGAQYSSLPHVPLDAMQPGDLVFWGAGGSQHVGMYVGNGLMIHAPHTGDVVKIAAVYGRPVGAARPGI